jgi:hypothetical protein
VHDASGDLLVGDRRLPRGIAQIAGLYHGRLWPIAAANAPVTDNAVVAPSSQRHIVEPFTGGFVWHAVALTCLLWSLSLFVPVITGQPFAQIGGLALAGTNERQRGDGRK